ncbi:MAG: tyrosine-type recombinase/integrase, partial [Bacteroidota bacterium]
RPQSPDPNAYVFPVLRTEIMAQGGNAAYREVRSQNVYCNRRLKVLAEMLNLSHSMSFHTARHTFATMWLRKGGNIKYLQKILGHKKFSSTEVYLHLVDTDINEAMHAFDAKLQQSGAAPESKANALGQFAGIVRSYVHQAATMWAERLDRFAQVYVDRIGLMQYESQLSLPVASQRTTTVRVFLVGEGHGEAVPAAFEGELNGKSLFGDAVRFSVDTLSPADAAKLADPGELHGL